MTVFFELCVVFCDEVECRATVGRVTQSIGEMEIVEAVVVRVVSLPDRRR